MISANRLARSFILPVLLFSVLVSGTHAQESTAPVPTRASPNASVVEITARGLTFEAPDSTRSGWTTFRLKNKSNMVHFAVLERLPEGIGIEDHQTEVAPVFQKGMDLLKAGKSKAASKAFAGLPKWFGNVVFLGGPGLIAPGRTAQTTVRLTPGTYLLECYVKTGGVFHSYNSSPGEYGMVHELHVTKDSSAAEEPEPTLEVSLSSKEGIEVEGTARSGRHTVAVHFADQTAHEHFLGHDVHLVRLGDGVDRDSVAMWMNWTRPGSLESPAPAPFLGGVHEMPAGKTGYFTVDLMPGRYAWVAEVPKPDEKDMLRVFTVR